MMHLVVALLAAQVDAGPGDAGAPPVVCGSLTDEGACYGDVAAWCSEDNVGGSAAAADVLVEDCREGTCGDIDGLGAWCFADDGAPCAFEAGARAAVYACGPVQGAPDPAWGCDLVEGCVALGVAGCGAGCADGDRLRLACAPFGQPMLFPCGAFGGTCAGDGCSGLSAGAPCDERLACADGVSCVAGACVADQPGVAVDAGPGDPVPPPAPPPLCGAGAGFASAVVLVTLAWRRRRRP
ncbi:MAG: hypothetical protein A2138_08035 [Deltaproteobacteria bacterium RBG_16_71_12]|nr:MAG: hypothetical protein A2138_08035 [Deltaproteobacteria bacterium RBG_16_71_12]